MKKYVIRKKQKRDYILDIEQLIAYADLEGNVELRGIILDEFFEIKKTQTLDTLKRCYEFLHDNNTLENQKFVVRLLTKVETF